MNIIEKVYDIVVVGAGHAGCEAALASARLGLNTVIFTVSVDSIALMPCNPNIGGSSKGHLVRELDALGGEMGKCIDKTFINAYEIIFFIFGHFPSQIKQMSDSFRYILVCILP